MRHVRALRSGPVLRLTAGVFALLCLQASCGVDNEVPSQRAEDGGRPADPWSAPLSFVVVESLRPSADSAGTLDDRDRRVEVLASPDGETMELVVDELIVGTVNPEALAPLLARRGGEVLWQVAAGSAGEPGFTLVRIEPRAASPEDVVRLVREMGQAGVGLEGGQQRVSHREVLGVLAALLEESALLDTPVLPNVVMAHATVGDGTTIEADDVGSTGQSRDACTWPHMRSGGAQDIGVCDAWRLLVEQGLAEGRVDVAVIDQGFVATPDTPQGSAFYVPGMVYEGAAFWEGPPSATRCAAGGACSWHGAWTSSALGAVPDNAWGSAGPGGLNARIQHIDPVAMLPSAARSRVGHGVLTLDQLQAGLAGALVDRLPPRSVAYVGVATQIPWPFSVLVQRAMDPLFVRARAADILVFAPAGDAHDVDQTHAISTARTSGWETSLTFPCELTGVVCVGALARDSNLRDDQSAHGSPPPTGFEVAHQHGSVDIYGPGTVLVGPEPGDELSATASLLRERRGTSLAAAFTAGVAVQMWAARPSLSAADVEQILLDTMHDGSPSPEVVGWVDAAAAVDRAACPTATITRYRDFDGDGFGDAADAEESCFALEGYVDVAGDCDDTDETVFPGAEERCDGVDQNCDPDDEEGLDCDDGLFCTRDDVCEADGTCTGRSSACDDDERCVEDQEACVAEGCRDDGDCDDDLYCNGDETCDTDSGECQPGERDLDDEVACTTDSCSESDRRVRHVPNDGSCDDGVFCNGVETCDADTGCEPGADPCPDSVCDEANDECVACATAEDCDDGLFCNGAETCDPDEGTCVPGTPPSLSDGVNCTIDLCNEFTDSISHAPSNVACDDGLYCNGAETCHVTLGCRPGTPPALSDSVPCTIDTCDEATDSVEHTPSNAACSDGLFCNGAETCHATLGCQPGTPPTLSDSVPCTTDSCDETADVVRHVPNDAACSNGLYCDGAETCHATLGCRPGNGPCNEEVCDEVLNFCDVCTDDEDCDDGRFCNGEETCNTDTGVCSSGVAPSDPDSVDCTIDTCDEDSDAFIHTPDDGACDDGLFCNGEERCDELLDCQDGTPPSPSDAVSCTLDSCDEDTDSFVHAPVNGACSDGLYCTGIEACHVTLGCQASGDPCSSGHCNETLDVCVACLVDDDCSDDLFCNGVELCDVGAGICGPGGGPIGLDDGLGCTIDTCDEVSDSIQHTPDDGVCDDELYCNGVETCEPGEGCALGTPPDLDDGVACTDDSCDEDADEVVHTPNDGACDDALYCNGVETCDPQLDCQPGTPPDLDDGVLCTDDSCDEDADEVVHAPNDGACDDALYCNGAESCDPVDGCESGRDACPGRLCDEDTDRCNP